jgi:AraC-like DNA-binding protein
VVTSKPSKFPLPKKGEIRVAPICALPDLLRDFAVAPGPLLKSFGLTEDFFRHPDNPISFQLAGRLLQACAHETCCDHFGLLLGQLGNAMTLGAPGFLIRHAPDVATALHEAIVNLDVHDRAAMPFLEVGDQTTVFGYAIHQQDIEGAGQIGDIALAMIWNIMRGLCGSEWLPLEIRFRRDKPDDIGIYHQFFQAPLRFNATQNALTFPTVWLTKPVQFADPMLRQHFLRHIQDMRRHIDLDFRDKAYQTLLLLVGEERCTLEELARHFSMHQRTLNRRLKDSGTSFRELHNQARHQTARQLLSDTRTSIESIASLLGYSGATAFNRAFTQWEGTPPAQWRRHAQLVSSQAPASP